MSSLRYVILILCLKLLSLEVSAQYQLEGQVLRNSDKTPLPGVEIYAHQNQEVRISDERGRFIFESIPAGKQEFTFFNLEYNTKTITIELSENTSQTIELSKLSLDLSNVVIAERREELFAIKQLADIEGTSIFAGKKTEVVVLDLVKGNLANNNGRQVFAQVAGLNIYEGNDGGLQLNLGGRGLDPNRTSNFNTRQNGYDISADVLGYPESYYSPPADAISEIRLIRGASSLQYGTQFGGLIDFRLRKIPSFKKTEFYTKQTVASYGTFNTFNSIGVNQGKFSFNGFYNYKKGDGYRPNSAYDAHNVFVSLDYNLGSRTKIGVEWTYFKYLAKQAGGLTDQQFQENPRMSTRDRNWFEVDWKLYELRLNHSFGKSSDFSLSVFGLNASRNSLGFRGNPIDLNANPITSLDEQDADGNYILPRDLILGKFQNYGAEARYLNRYKLLDRNAVLLCGAKYYKSDNSSIQGPGSLQADADFNLYTQEFPDYANQSNFDFPNRNVSFFMENIFYISDGLSIIPGFRFEHIETKSEGSYTQVIFDNAENPIAINQLEDNKQLKRDFALFGLGLKYKKSKELQLVANLSQNYRSVTFSDIRVVSPTFIVDPDIKDEKGFTADIGIKGRIDKFLSYDFTIYSVLYDDRIGIILNDRANRVRKNIGKGFIAGTESLLSMNFARLMTPGERDYQFNGFVNAAFTHSRYLESEENNVEGKRIEFIPTVNIKTGITAGYKSFEATYQFTHLSEQFTDVQNSGIAEAGDKRSGIVGPIPAYSISDLSLNYSFGRFKIDAGINNLFDRAYFTRRATGYPGPGIIPSDGRSFFLSLSAKI